MKRPLLAAAAAVTSALVTSALLATGCVTDPTAAGAAGAAPLTLVADRTTLEANGTDAITLTATAPSAASGGGRVVVSFTATGGLLSSSAVAPDAQGVATVVLRADREEALLGRPEKPVTVRATITRSLQDVETATVDVVMVTPTTGAPAISVVADPPAALADGTTPVTLTINTRRLPSGTALSIATSAGTLSTTSVTIEADSATATLIAPTSPSDAVVTVREPGGAQGSTVVSFVEDGAAQFDLNGTFAQMAPARVRLRAGTLTPNPQCIVAPAFVKVDIIHDVDTGAIDATYTTCFVTLAPVRSIVGEVTNEAPPAFVGSIPQVHAVMTLADVALGALFDPPQSVVVSGAELDDPDDELPTDENDARVRDSDGDGRPGVTVINSLGGEQNITFRNTGDTVGVIESSNRIVGASEGDMFALPESSVLGAGDAFIPDMESIPSVFEMVRVDGQHGSADMDTNGDGAISCNEIVDAADFLFTVEAPPTPLDCAGVP